MNRKGDDVPQRQKQPEATVESPRKRNNAWLKNGVPPSQTVMELLVTKDEHSPSNPMREDNVYFGGYT